MRAVLERLAEVELVRIVALSGGERGEPALVEMIFPAPDHRRA